MPVLPILESLNGVVHALQLPGDYFVAHFKHISAHPPDAAPGKSMKRAHSPSERKPVEKSKQPPQLLPYLIKLPCLRQHQAATNIQPEEEGIRIPFCAQASH